MELVLYRTYYAHGTNGQLVLNGSLVSYSIELPWNNNKPQDSCIPEGRYELRKRYSPKFGAHLEVMEVPGRELVLIHPANNALRELKGCIAPVSVLTGEGEGERSKAALSIVTEHAFAAFSNFEPVFLTIQSKQS
ncbi:MAG TPA: DUF5675 family protein [Chitinophagaceae bacterium]|jgi:hypothetical protein